MSISDHSNETPGGGLGLPLADPFAGLSDDALMEKAKEYHAKREPRRSLALCERVLKSDPDRPDALNLAGVLASLLGENDKGIAYLEKLSRLLPDNALVFNNLGSALRSANRSEEAAGALETAVRLNPDDPAPYGNLAQVYHDLKRYADALPAYEKCLGGDPHNDRVREYYGYCLMAMGDAQAALKEFEAWENHGLFNVNVLMYKAAALREMGRTEEADALYDFQKFVKVYRPDPPKGYDSIREFNQAIIAQVKKDPTLKYSEPASDEPGVARGQMTDFFAEDTQGPIGEMLKIIDGMARDYFEYLRSLDPHPYTNHPPTAWNIHAWSVVLDGHYHQPHIHYKSYLSGCYYLQVPKMSGSKNANNAGNIEFGNYPDEFACVRPPAVESVHPQEGEAILFPAYFLHNTVPFVADAHAERISFPFDIVPKD